MTLKSQVMDIKAPLFLPACMSRRVTHTNLEFLFPFSFVRSDNGISTKVVTGLNLNIILAVIRITALTK